MLPRSCNPSTDGFWGACFAQAVNQLATHFDGFKTIPKISEMRGKIDTIKLMLRSAVFKDFEGYEPP
jgi:hypothetical protein